MGLLNSVKALFDWGKYPKEEQGMVKAITGKAISIRGDGEDSEGEAGYKLTSALSFEQLDDIRRDPTVKLALLTPSMIIRSRIKSYTHPDPEIELFIRENLVKVKFRKALRKMMAYRWQGGSIHEMVWEPGDDGKIWLKELALIHPRTWFGLGLPKEGKDVIQEAGNEKKTIPRYKCIILENDDEFTEGGSILDTTVFNHWQSKYNNLKKWDAALDLFGSPGLIGWLKNTGDISTITGNLGKGDGTDPKQVAVNRMVQTLAKFKTSRAAAFSDDITLEKIQISQVGDNYLVKIAYDDKMMCRSMLMPSLIISNDDKTGSYATANTHLDFFMLMLQSEMEKLTSELIDQMIRPLIMFNFKTLEYGKFNIDDIAEKDYMVWANILTQLTVHGYLTPENKAHVRKVLMMLNLLDDELNTSDKESAAKNNGQMLGEDAETDSDLDDLDED